MLVHAVAASIIGLYPLFCLITSARYEMMAYPSLTMEFGRYDRDKSRELLTDVGIILHSSGTHRDFWFILDEGSAPFISLVRTSDFKSAGWTGDPVKDSSDDKLQYIAMDAKLRAQQMPNSKSAAPQLILIPLLADWLKYKSPQEFAPTAFFRLVGCRR